MMEQKQKKQKKSLGGSLANQAESHQQRPDTAMENEDVFFSSSFPTTSRYHRFEGGHVVCL
jgi:hypothetical protein